MPASSVRRLTKLLGGVFAQMRAQLFLSPLIKDACDVLPVNTKAIRDVVERCPTRPFAMIVDLDGDRASHSIA